MQTHFNLMEKTQSARDNLILIWCKYGARLGQDRRDVVLMNKKDKGTIGVKKDNKVNIKSKTGFVKDILARPFDIKQGAAVMYYPEVNKLISQNVDPHSRTPGFKSTLVTVQPYS